MGEKYDKVIIELIEDSFKLICSKYIEYREKKSGLSFIEIDDKLRISEQELRFSLVETILKQDKYYEKFYYSVETPTVNTYRFSSEGERRASTDLTLYDNKSKKSYNIEFKYGSPSEKNITKDIEKILREDNNGIFLNLYNNIDFSTIDSILRKIKEYNGEGKVNSFLFGLFSLKKEYCYIKEHNLSNIDLSKDKIRRDLLNE